MPGTLASSATALSGQSVRRAAQLRPSPPWIDRTSQPRGANLQSAGDVVLDGVTVRRPNGALALHRVTLTVAAGEFVVVLGRPGSGASTLVRALGGALPLAGGQVFIGGRELSGPDLLSGHPRRSRTSDGLSRALASGGTRSTMLGIDAHADRDSRFGYGASVGTAQSFGTSQAFDAERFAGTELREDAPWDARLAGEAEQDRARGRDRRSSGSALLAETAPVGRGTVLDHVIAGTREPGQRWPRLPRAARDGGRALAERALARVGLLRRQRVRVSELTAEEGRRLALARALASAPGLLLAADPSAGLDDAGAARIMAELSRLNIELGITVLAGLADPELAREHGARIVGMRAGEIVYDGPAEHACDSELEWICAG